MKPAYNWLIGSLAVISLLISAFDFGVYINKAAEDSRSSQPFPSRTKVSQRLLEKGQVLATCFAKGTKVLIASFQEKNIEDINVGDVVLTRESEASPKLVEAKVIKLLEPHPSQYLIINGKLKLTQEHVIFASGEWIYAKDLRAGDWMFGPNNNKVKIASIEKSKDVVDVYNLEVEKYRTLFADGFYVHNYKGGWQLYLKNNSTDNQSVTDATIIMQTRSPYYSICKSTGSPDWQFKPGSPGYYSIYCDLNPGQSHPNQATVSISRSGFGSKIATVNYNGSTMETDTIYFDALPPSDSQPPAAPSNLRTTSVGNTSLSLAWNASTDNVGVTGYKVYRDGKQIATTGSTSYTNSELSPGSTYSYHVKAYDAAGNLSASSNTISVSTTLTIKDVSLPATFTQSGSTTTNLAAITDPANVPDLTVEVVGKNKISWTGPVNLSSADTANKFRQLDIYIKATTTGIVELDSKALPELNKKATITMFNLPFVSTPKVLVDGKADPKVVSNIKYSKGALTFNAAHFTKLEAAPTLEINEPKNGFTTSKADITLIGRITDPTATVSAKLNNQSLGNLKVATKSGEFSTKLRLTKGKNLIKVEAASKFGPPLVATVSGVFKPLNLLPWLVGAGAVVALSILAAAGYWYYKKRRFVGSP